MLKSHHMEPFSSSRIKGHAPEPLNANSCDAQVPNEASACYRQLYPQWAALAAEPHGCELEVVQTRQSFGRAFDDDDTLAYSPEYTAAIILSE